MLRQAGALVLGIVFPLIGVPGQHGIYVHKDVPCWDCAVGHEGYSRSAVWSPLIDLIDKTCLVTDNFPYESVINTAREGRDGGGFGRFWRHQTFHVVGWHFEPFSQWPSLFREKRYTGSSSFEGLLSEVLAPVPNLFQFGRSCRSDQKHTVWQYIRCWYMAGIFQIKSNPEYRALLGHSEGLHDGDVLNFYPSPFRRFAKLSLRVQDLGLLGHNIGLTRVDLVLKERDPDEGSRQKYFNKVREFKVKEPSRGLPVALWWLVLSSAA
jgi:hypothetical protein